MRLIRRRPPLLIPPAAMEAVSKAVAIVALGLIATLPPVSTAHADANAAATGPGGTALAASTPRSKFSYDWPAAADRIPALAAWLRADAAHTRARYDRLAAADPRVGAPDFAPYESDTPWRVVADIPGWLSLSARRYSFSGGAHGNSVFRTLLWDKAAGRMRAPLDLFTSPAALSAAIRPAFCAALDRERAKRRQGTPAIAEFDQCIDPVKEVVILGSAGHVAFDRIGILIAPYEAGPYAEGSYEVTLPVTPAILALVRPPFRRAFAARASGSQNGRNGAT